MGLESCDSVLAILNGTDPGTIFEVGYAIAKGKPVTIFSERTPPEDLTMMYGTNCRVYGDFSSAAYNVVWDSIKRGE
jgi:nucleoside 2-deoxyribosyltransferase